jgi:cell division protease FtsH
MSGRWLRNSFIYLLILVAIVAIVFTLLPDGSSSQETTLTEFVSEAQNENVDRVDVNGTELTYWLKDDVNEQTFKSKMEEGDTARQVLQDAGIEPKDFPPIKIKEDSFWSNLPGLLIQFLPIIFIVAILFFFLRQAQGSSNQAMSFGKSKARMFSGTRSSVTFLDVAGVEEAKEELGEVVEFLKFPEKFAALGARIPKPGTGKTLLSKAVAGEAGVPFFSISGSEFVEMFVGVGASRVRDLFDQAKRNSPCIVFIDEIDAVGRHRGAGLGGSHDEREQTLNQILVEMDGFDTSTNVIIVAATNRPDILDPALLRPGRFDRQVMLDSPDVKGRRAILDVHAKGKPLDTGVKTGVKLETIAKQTPGFSGADLANLVNEACILAARRGKKKVTMSEFDEAVDRVIAGPERKSRVISQREREIIAYHEAGHALVGQLLAKADPPYKISIVSRGMAGGFTRFLPEEDRHLYAKSQFEDMLAATLGGMVAEELVFGEATTGLGREISEQRNYSEKVAEKIDDEVRGIVDRAYDTSRKVLTENRDKLENVVKVLLEEETIEGDALQAILNAQSGKESEELVKTEKSPKPSETADESPEKPPAQPPKTEPGLAWETQSRLGPDQSS